MKAKNIVNYIRIIHRILAPGGVWINLGKLYNHYSNLLLFKILIPCVGPLLWHWENNNSNDPSIELDMEEIKALIRTIGFEISVSLLSPLRFHTSCLYTRTTRMKPRLIRPIPITQKACSVISTRPRYGRPPKFNGSAASCGPLYA